MPQQGFMAYILHSNLHGTQEVYPIPVTLGHRSRTVSQQGNRAFHGGNFVKWGGKGHWGPHNTCGKGKGKGKW